MSKNKFFKKLLVAGLCALTATATVGTVVTASGCKKDGEEQEQEQTQKYTVTYDLDGGTWSNANSVEVEAGAKVTKPSNPTKEGYNFGGWTYNGSAYDFDTTVSGDITLKATWNKASYAVSWNLDGGTWGGATLPATVQAGGKVTRPQGVPTKANKVFGGWATPDGKLYDFNTAVTGDLTLKAVWKEIEYETVTTVCDFASLADLYGESKTDAEIVSGKFTFTKGLKFEKANKCVNTQGTREIYIVLAGENDSNTLSFRVTNASGNFTGLTVKDESGTVLDSCGKDGKTFSLSNLPAGKYTITGNGGACRIYELTLTESMQKSSPISITVSGGTRDFFVGSDFNSTGLIVTLNYQNGRQDEISTGYTLDDKTAYNKAEVGKYTITVTYTEGNFTDSYDVNVYSYESLKLGTDKIVKGANTSANNGTYVNHALRQFYFKGETFSNDGLTVILNGKNGEATKDFIVGSGFTVSTPDMSTAGKKTVTVTYVTNGLTKTADFEIYVVEKDAALATAAAVTVNVDKDVTDAEVGTVSNGAYNFQTIQQSLDFLENCGIPASAQKTINLAEGEYWEKLEITVPNLTIIGAGADNTLIEYDSLYGIPDASGFVHTTDSTATLNVRESAVNFTIKNVTVSNYWNSLERFNEKLGANYPEHRALALLIQADKTTVDGCKLLGYQDTLELFTGRQYIVNTYISGTTDFIFGTNNTTYFKDCTIHSISNGKTDGGYITAFKGNNRDANDAVTYGAIFDGCNFTADSDVLTNGNTAIGRPWGKYAAVAVINSDLDAHISTTSTGEASKNERYVTMSGNKPTESTVKFVEYNNTGEGAITTAVSGMKMLTAAEAANYSNLSVVFGTTNGKITYSDTWNPVAE
ncbi:MAG: InlB B-repeat-containing protein [Clostridia bacterium]|nr:InlB B-repeat-containing protein [Clostridia bacterium]